jgi:exopolysaccharide production protein ExoZ
VVGLLFLVEATMANENERLKTLDYLRGLAALSILVYHFSTWNFGGQSAQMPIGRMGIYGVALFYILSGMTMYHVYSAQWETTWRQLKDFVLKRVFRIFPLLWLAILLTLLLNQAPVDWRALVLDLSGLFAFLKWESNYALGAWSIGNELAFYVFFPLIMLVAKAGRTWLLGLMGLMSLVFLYYAFVVIDPALPLTESWLAYSNPLNQGMLFMAGVGIGAFAGRVQWSSALRWGLLACGLLLLFGCPSGSDPATIAAGLPRVVITLGCVIVCLAAYRWQLALPTALARPLSWLGEVSYGVYLLHPIFYNLVEQLNIELLQAGVRVPVSLRLVAAISLTLLMSHLSYRYFEKPFIRLGRRMGTPRK